MTSEEQVQEIVRRVQAGTLSTTDALNGIVVILQQAGAQGTLEQLQRFAQEAFDRVTTSLTTEPTPTPTPTPTPEPTPTPTPTPEPTGTGAFTTGPSDLTTSLPSISDIIASFQRGEISLAQLETLLLESGLSPETIATLAPFQSTVADPQQALVQGPIPPAELPEELLAGLPAFGRATRTLGINTGPGGGAFGRFIGNRFEPASTAFTARQFLTGGDPGLGGNPFQSFVEQNLLGGGIRQQAAQTFQGLLDLARGGGANAAQNQFIAPADFGQGQASAQLARSALGNQIGGFALSRFAPSARDIFSAFAQSDQAGNASSFLPFAQQFLGIRPVANAFSSFV